MKRIEEEKMKLELYVADVIDAQPPSARKADVSDQTMARDVLGRQCHAVRAAIRRRTDLVCCTLARPQPVRINLLQHA